MADFKHEYLGSFIGLTVAQRIARGLWADYVLRTEAFDRTIPHRMVDGEAMPMPGEPRQQSTKFASRTMVQLRFYIKAFRISSEDFQAAKRWATQRSTEEEALKQAVADSKALMARGEKNETIDQP